ncbi:short subunit dehydrogenase [Brenneria salicis ATCC 15712 = DSM 30166]|uniref:Short subunit dehydrogenase n=1 Tax=Brenneria salicis ATCC 15712 = DSM 30166 TaxID=714314 RepID=A0A366I618_9GAMM|nr:short subunit dehydrogenase [Brenneria salicis ATCC 15712 = DSM 30166]
MSETLTSSPVALISGATSGIGLALAKTYARKGVRVAAGYYPADPHDPIKAQAAVAAAGGEAIWLPLDVGLTDSVASFTARAYQHFGRIDYMVANAGVLRRSPIGERRQMGRYAQRGFNRRHALFSRSFRLSGDGRQSGRGVLYRRGVLWLAGSCALCGGEGGRTGDLSLRGGGACAAGNSL